MRSPTDHTATQWAEVASALVDRWSRHAVRVGTHLEGPRYGADDALSDLAATVSLTAETWLVLASELLACTGGESRGGPNVVESEPFLSPAPSAILAVDGPLRNLSGSDSLLPGLVSFRRLTAAGAPAFTLRVDASGHHAGAYRGTVVASTPGPPEPPPAPVRVPVRIIVP